MSAKRVVIDIDGVLAEWCEPFRKLMNSYGASIFAFGPDEPAKWDWTKAAPEEESKAWAYIQEHQSWWDRLPKHPDFDHEARQLIADLHVFHDVTFVTKRQNGRFWTKEWLKREVIAEPFLLMSYGDKAHILLGMRPHVVIEDKLSTLVDYAKMEGKRKSRKLILVDRPWNRADRPETITIAASTKEALKIAKEWVNRV